MVKNGNRRTRSRSFGRERDINQGNREQDRNYERKRIISKSRSRNPSRPRSRSPRCRSRSHEKDRGNIKYRTMISSGKKVSRREKSKEREDPYTDSRSRRSDRDQGDCNEKVSKNIDKIKVNVLMIDNGFDSEIDMESVPKKLQAAEMQKRRERLEKWKAFHRKDASKDIRANNAFQAQRMWDLHDDNVYEEGVRVELHDKLDNIIFSNNTEISFDLNTKDIDSTTATLSRHSLEEHEEDPLDAFMRGVQEEVSKDNLGFASQTGPKGSTQKVVIVQTDDGAKISEKMDKGEIIEQNMDSLEYSSEEEIDDFETISYMNTLNASKGKKELDRVDHTKIQYPTFRRNFYVEVPELARMTQECVEGYRCELEGIRIKGKGCPKPIKDWAHAGVSRKEMDVLKKLGFEKPTPIQCQAIPAIMSGRDLIGIAKTGSGKTLAFLLPMFRHILDQSPLEENDGPISIIVAPTRELCMQIGKDAKRFCKYLNLRVAFVYGGTGISDQISELKRGAEIIVCTPGRMIDMLAANSGRVTNLRRCTYIVLDEADRMFDMGFEPQVMRIVDNIRPDRQTVMFSATFPRQMEALARKILNTPIEVQVGGRSAVCKEVEQHVIVLEDEKKFLKLLELLGIYQQQGSVLVFVNKQENSDMLLKELMKVGYPCLSLHGGIDQYDRDSTITDFKSGKCKLLVATSVAARGLDIKHLILVVNYDCPNHYEDYVHRCGRTGRAGNKGLAYTFVTPEQARYAGDITKALELSGANVPQELTQLWSLYKVKKQSAGNKVKWGGGFTGSGYKFDDAEDQFAKEKKNFQKHALGLQDYDENIEEDVDQKIEKMMAPRTINVEGTPVFSNKPTVTTIFDSLDKLAAKKLAPYNLAEKNLGPDTKAEVAVMKRDVTSIMTSQSSITARKVAEQIVEKLNRKLNYQPPEEQNGTSNLECHLLSMKSNNHPVQEIYEEELEINDFPQQARWKITSKATISQIADYSEADITVKGMFVTPGKRSPVEGKKLYLAIKSTSEFAVSKAKSEICRILKEEMIRIQKFTHPFIRQYKGHYNVL